MSHVDPSVSGGERRPDEFVRLAPASGWLRGLTVAIVGLGVAVAVVPALIFGPERFFGIVDRPLWLHLVGGVCEGIEVAVLIYIWTLIFRPSPRINMGARAFKIRRRVIPFAEVDRAVMKYETLGKHPTIQLRFGLAKGRTATFTLYSGSEPPEAGSPRALLVEAFRESKIAKPEHVDERSARLARRGYARHLDKSDAIAVVIDPPPPPARRL